MDVQAALAGNLPVINVPDLLPIPEEQQGKMRGSSERFSSGDSVA